ncbi:MAG: hypothetical protein FWE32_00015 [Oscillospiraceae bacterium]|nr:hypothetical protein [Oscillospiraceae bacterium]
MAKQILNSTSDDKQAPRLAITDKQVEILARRLMPEIKRFFADEDVRREFELWKNARSR